MQVLHIDIETFSDVDLQDCGVYKYVESPNFEILLLAYSWNDGPVYVVDLKCGEQIPDEVRAAILLNTIKKAWNANFERVCLAKHFRLPMHPFNWECSMVKACMVGLPAKLETAADVLNLSDQKDAIGKQLIRYFCIPCKPTAKNGMRTRNLPEHDPEKWEQFKVYCGKDVAAERTVDNKIAFYHVPESEKLLWNLDQEINDRGIRIDQPFIRNAIHIDEQHRERLTKEAIKLTGLNNPNSAAQLKQWLQMEMPFATVEKLRKEDIPTLKEWSNGYINSNVINRVLEIRQEMSKTSTKKYLALLNYVCKDGWVRGILQYYGAGRTGRWAGRGIQPHNLPRNYLKDLDLARQCVSRGDGEALDMLFGNVPDTLSQLIRTAFIPREGYDFKVSDFKAIEARVLAWLTGEQWRLDVFNSHGKIYEAGGAKMFKIPIESIIKGSLLYQKCKISELALGYQGGVEAMKTMGALKEGILEEELPDIVHAWRIENPNIVKYWRQVNDAAIEAIEQPGMIISFTHGMSFQVRKGVLFIKLPSGRELSYLSPKLEHKEVIWVKLLKDHLTYKKGHSIVVSLKEAAYLVQEGIGTVSGEPFDKISIIYMGMNQTTKQWGKQYTYGGKLVENIDQAIARDCLAEGMTRVHDEGYCITMHVHDEVVTEMPIDVGSLEELNHLLSTPISWAKGLPLGADGFVGSYYKK